jgi:tellurite resistance protein TehA-like permease
MGTGIVSIALSLDGLQVFSRILLGAAAIAWAVLALVVSLSVFRQPDRVRRDASTPAALTGVAATAVLGAHVATFGWTWVAVASLGVAVALWCALLAPVLVHWSTPTAGVSLMLAVATESLAVLSATIARGQHQPWLLDTTLAPFVLGLGFYVFIMVRFDRRELVRGRGDHWVTGGALAISALAAGDITLAAGPLRALEGVHTELKLVTLLLWAAAVAWLPVLVGGELLRPRLVYDVRRWSTVFPIGMYATCSFIVGKTAAAPAITDFARFWTWAGVGVWIMVTAATVRRGLQVVRRDPIGVSGRPRRAGPEPSE